MDNVESPTHCEVLVKKGAGVGVVHRVGGIQLSQQHVQGRPLLAIGQGDARVVHSLHSRQAWLIESKTARQNGRATMRAPAACWIRNGSISTAGDLQCKQRLHLDVSGNTCLLQLELLPAPQLPGSLNLRQGKVKRALSRGQAPHLVPLGIILASI